MQRRTIATRTADLPGEIRRADIIIAAIGRGRNGQGQLGKPGPLIDVGINRVPDASKKRWLPHCW